LIARLEKQPLGSREVALSGRFAELTDAARDAAIADYVSKLRDLMDWRKGHPILRDKQARFAIVAGASATYRPSIGRVDIGGEDEANEWMTGEVHPQGGI
jgi:hypothetical protein